MKKKKEAPVEVRQREEERFYIIPGGEEVPSVTTILSVIDKSGPLVGWAVRETCDYIEKHALELWGALSVGEGLQPSDLQVVLGMARKEATRIKKEAGDIGTMIHNAVQDWALDTIAGKPFFAHFEEERQAKAWEAFLKFAEEYALVPKKSEIKVINRLGKYGGTVDLVASICPPGETEPKTYVLDIKSSNFFLEIPYGPQVAAYDACFVSEDVIYDGIGVVRLDKTTGDAHFHDLTEKRTPYLDVFTQANFLWQALREFKKGAKAK